jgi:phage/plasmid-associated DNA primase
VLTNDQKHIRPYRPGFVPDDYCTVQVPITPDSTYDESRMPNWMSVLEKTLPDPLDQMALQEMFGYVFFPGCQLHVFHCMCGKPNAGKDTILKILQDMLGNTKTSAAPLRFLDDKHTTESLLGSIVRR